MNFKKTVSGILAAAMAVTGLSLTTITTMAYEDPNPTIIFEGVGESSGSWSQAFSAATLKNEGGTFDPSILTEKTKIEVTYEADSAPEVILQSWTDGKPESAGWAKVAAEATNNGVAVYTYASMVAAFGTSDFTTYLDNFMVGDTGSALKVTKIALKKTEGMTVLFEGSNESSGSWGQAYSSATLKNEGGTFDSALLNENVTIEVSYDSASAPEVILQSWTDGKPESAGWAKVAAEATNNGVAVYTYASMVAAFGSSDFVTYLDNFMVGDTGNPLTVTKIVLRDSEKKVKVYPDTYTAAQSTFTIAAGAPKTEASFSMTNSNGKDIEAGIYTITWTSDNANVIVEQDATVPTKASISATDAASNAIVTAEIKYLDENFNSNIVKIVEYSVTATSGVVEVETVAFALDEVIAGVGEVCESPAVAVTPDALTTPTMVYTISDETIATIDAATGKVTALKAGEAIVTYTVTTPGAIKSDTYKLTVKTVDATGVTLKIAPESIEIGASAKATPTIAPENTTDKTVTFVSSDTAIATVDTDGTIKGVAIGKATITATTANGKTATADVTVTAASTAKTIFEGNVSCADEWGQALKLVTLKNDEGTFDPSIIKENTRIEVTYSSATAPELVFQSWTDGKPATAGWAKVACVADAGGVATFSFDSMKEAFGSADFVTYLDCLYVGCTGNALTVTKVVLKENTADDPVIITKVNPTPVTSVTRIGETTSMIVAENVVLNTSSEEAKVLKIDMAPYIADGTLAKLKTIKCTFEGTFSTAGWIDGGGAIGFNTVDTGSGDWLQRDYKVTDDAFEFSVNVPDDAGLGTLEEGIIQIGFWWGSVNEITVKSVEFVLGEKSAAPVVSDEADETDETPAEDETEAEDAEEAGSDVAEDGEDAEEAADGEADGEESAAPAEETADSNPQTGVGLTATLAALAMASAAAFVSKKKTK